MNAPLRRAHRSAALGLLLVPPALVALALLARPAPPVSGRVPAPAPRSERAPR